MYLWNNQYIHIKIKAFFYDKLKKKVVGRFLITGFLSKKLF